MADNIKYSIGTIVEDSVSKDRWQKIENEYWQCIFPGNQKQNGQPLWPTGTTRHDRWFNFNGTVIKYIVELPKEKLFTKLYLTLKQ